MSFKKFINEALAEKELFINPKTGKKWTAKNIWDRIKFIYDYKIKQGVPDERLWVSFTDTPRLNIYPAVSNRGGKTTPTGVFGYPMKLAVNSKATDDGFNLPSFTERAYIIAFESLVDVFDIGGEANSTAETDALKTIKKNSNGREATEMVAQNVVQKLNSVMHFYPQLSPIFDRYISQQVGSVLDALNHARIDSPEEYIERLITDRGYYGGNSFAMHGHLDSKGLTFNPKALERILQKVPIAKKYLINNNFVPANVAPQFISLISKEIHLSNEVKTYFDLINNKEKIIKFMHVAEKLIQKELESFHKNIDLSQIPQIEKIKELAQKLNLDLHQAISDSVNNYEEISSTKNNRLFLYRLTKNLAMQWGKKDKQQGKTSNENWNTRWNKMLQYIGLHNIADIQHTGHIHSAEQSQGIFFNPKTIKVIEILPNVKFSDSIPTIGKTGVYKAHKMQRASNSMRSFSRENMTQDEMTAEAFYNKFSNLVRYIRSDLDYGHVTLEKEKQLAKMVKIADKLINKHPANSDLIQVLETVHSFISKMQDQESKDIIRSIVKKYI